MALRTPPSWLQNGTHPAENDRLTSTGVIWTSGGVADYTSMTVSQSATPAMTVQISEGHAIIAGTESSNQGFYIAYNDAASTVSIAAASATLPRIDRIVVTVQDSYYSGANNQVLFQVITGTPNASPVAPAAPANAVTLAYIAVAANATSIVNANITDMRVRAQFSDIQITAGGASADSVVINSLVGQTGKALRVNNSAGSQQFAISPNGTLTFSDGTTQTTAAYYNPNLIVNAQTGTTYTLQVSDAQKLVTLTNSSPITVTVASNATQALPVGTQIILAQYGTGQVTFVGASSPNPVTINGTPGLKLRTQYSIASIIQVSTDNWLLIGDISS